MTDTTRVGKPIDRSAAARIGKCMGWLALPICASAVLAFAANAQTSGEVVTAQPQKCAADQDWSPATGKCEPKVKSLDPSRPADQKNPQGQETVGKETVIVRPTADCQPGFVRTQDGACKPVEGTASPVGSSSVVRIPTARVPPPTVPLVQDPRSPAPSPKP